MHMPLVLTNRRRRGGSASAPAFSPSTLFSTTAIGIWLDPSDLSTMFSDRAGTTPVTTPGTVVGLRLDKSKGLALGAELCSDPSFNNAGAWTVGTGVSIAGGEAVFSSAASGQNLYIGDTGVVSGRYYLVTATVSSYGSGSIEARLGSASTDVALPTNGTGTFQGVVKADANNALLRFLTIGASTTLSLSSCSFRELAGNHAVAPTDAARPTYGVEPKGGRRNLLLATDTLATQSLTVTAVAHTLAFTGTGTVTLSGASIAGPLIGTGASDRVSLTFTPTAASLTLTVVGSVTLGQLELGSSVTAYQKVVTAYNVTESGVATTHYVQYDGSDDSMSTAAIDFTGTDKMSVFAGVRKLSDAALGVLAELSASWTLNDGAFILSAPNNTTTQRYGSISRGNGSVNAAGGSYVIDAGQSPDAAVLGATHDISGDSTVIRRNGLAYAAGTLDKGAGNFGNYPLFIGRRNNATLPFNGRDYGIIIVGKAPSGTEITDTETWLAAKTSGVTI